MPDEVSMEVYFIQKIISPFLMIYIDATKTSNVCKFHGVDLIGVAVRQRIFGFKSLTVSYIFL